MEECEVIVFVRWNLALGGNKKAAKAKARPEWHKGRLAIWRNFAMPSLIRQSQKDFEVWLLCDPARKEENGALAATLKDPRFRVVSDFGHQCTKVQKEGRADDLYLVCRMDSDDAMHRHLISDLVMAVPLALEWSKPYIQARKGYALNIETGRFYIWNNPSPAFFGTLRRRKQMARGIAPGICNHSKIAPEAFHLEMPGRFCVGLHRNNILNSPRASWLGRELKEGERDLARLEYGTGKDAFNISI